MSPSVTINDQNQNENNNTNSDETLYIVIVVASATIIIIMAILCYRYMMYGRKHQTIITSKVQNNTIKEIPNDDKQNEHCVGVVVGVGKSNMKERIEKNECKRLIQNRKSSEGVRKSYHDYNDNYEMDDNPELPESKEEEISDAGFPVSSYLRFYFFLLNVMKSNYLGCVFFGVFFDNCVFSDRKKLCFFSTEVKRYHVKK